MFRMTDFFHSVVLSTRGTDLVDEGTLLHAGFEPEDEACALMPVYSEIARRLSRNAYTSHGAA